MGQTEGNGFRLPLAQAQLADVLGFSTVHVNRTLQELRRRELIAWRGDLMEIRDWPTRVEAADFDPTCLDLVDEPR